MYSSGDGNSCDTDSDCRPITNSGVVMPWEKGWDEREWVPTEAEREARAALGAAAAARWTKPSDSPVHGVTAAGPFTIDRAGW
eukprot:gene2298-2960_t